MERRQTIKYVMVGLFVVVGFFVLFRLINRSVENQLDSRVKKINEERLSEKQPVATPAEERKEEKKELTVTTDLTSYPIEPHRKSELFKNQQYWDVMTRKALTESDVVGRVQGGDVFNGLATTPDEYKKQIERVDGRINAYKVRVNKDPNDEYARRKLQDLYMLKATVKVLRDTMVGGH